VADSVLVSTVRDNARARVDDASGAIAGDTEVLGYVQQAYKRLHGLYVGAEPDRFRTEATVTTSGSATSNLPADWLSTIGVDYQPATNTRYALRRLQEAERNAFNGVTNSQAMAYRVIGTTLALYPTPPSGQTYIHIYIPTTGTLTAGSSIDCRNGHEVFLEMLVARRLLEKEEAYDGRYEKQIDQIESELVEEAALRYMRDCNLMTSLSQMDYYWDPADYRR